MDGLEKVRERSQMILDAALGRPRGRYSSRFTRVSWHEPKQRWRVKVKRKIPGGKAVEFFKIFDDEEVAAAVADVVAMMVFPSPERLNFNWQRGNNHLPKNITVQDVYEWVVKAGMPIIRKPAGAI